MVNYMIKVDHGISNGSVSWKRNCNKALSGNQFSKMWHKKTFNEESIRNEHIYGSTE